MQRASRSLSSQVRKVEVLLQRGSFFVLLDVLNLTKPPKNIRFFEFPIFILFSLFKKVEVLLQRGCKITSCTPLSC